MCSARRSSIGGIFGVRRLFVTASGIEGDVSEAAGSDMEWQPRIVATGDSWGQSGRGIGLMKPPARQHTFQIECATTEKGRRVDRSDMGCAVAHAQCTHIWAVLASGTPCRRMLVCHLPAPSISLRKYSATSVPTAAAPCAARHSHPPPLPHLLRRPLVNHISLLNHPSYSYSPQSLA